MVPQSTNIHACFLYFHSVKDIKLIPVYNITRELIMIKWPVLIINSLSFMNAAKLKHLQN